MLSKRNLQKNFRQNVLRSIEEKSEKYSDKIVISYFEIYKFDDFIKLIENLSEYFLLIFSLSVQEKKRRNKKGKNRKISQSYLKI